MLFKPDAKDDAKQAGAKRSRRRGFVMTLITLAILGGLGYLGWTAMHQQPANNRNQRPDLPVPVLAATPRVQDVPVYLDGVGAIRALNTVTVRSQVDGKLIAVNFTEGQDVKKGDVVGEIDPAIYQAAYDQAVAKKAQDQAQLANQRIDLTRYEQLAASNAGSKQQADTQRALVAQTEALVKADQAAIDNAAATLSYTKIVAPISGRAGLRQVDQGNIIHASDTTGLVVITQLQPIAVWFSLPQQQIMRVNAAAAKGALAVDVFGNDGVTVIDTGKLTGIDNQVDQTTGTLRLKAEFPNVNYQLWPGQFVNVRLKVETLTQALVVPTSAVQRGPIGTFSYVIGEGDIVSAKPVTVTQQNEHDARHRQRPVGERQGGDDGLCQSVRRFQGDRGSQRSNAIGRSGATQALAWARRSEEGWPQGGCQRRPGRGAKGRTRQGRRTPRQAKQQRRRPEGTDRAGAGTSAKSGGSEQRSKAAMIPTTAA
ncbi:multidrug efflux system membrane fusion protein [Bradyrhizobium sp. LM2.7]